MDPVTLQLAIGMISQGMRAYADYADRAANGTLTAADIQAMADHLGADVDALRAEAQAKVNANP